MRQAQLEYDFDWILQRAFDAASRVHDGTRKEFLRVINRLPQFGSMVDSIFSDIEVGRKLTKCMAKYGENLLSAHEQGKKLALTTFCMSPAVCYAMDVVPLLLEPMTAIASLSRRRGTTEFMDYCVEVGFTETSCTGQRGALGAYLAGAAEKPDFVLINMAGICDTNANAFSFAAAHLDIPLFQLNFPPQLHGERSSQYHRKDYRAMISFISEQTGKSIEFDRLAKVMQEVKKQDAIIAELQDLQMLKPNPLPAIYSLFIYVGRFLAAGTEECTVLLEAMLATAKKNAARGFSGLGSGKEKARALFVYIDHYGAGIPMWNLFEKHGITHLGGILDRYYGQDAPYTEPGKGYKVDTNDMDSMIDSLAELNARMPMVKQIRGPYDAPDMWLDEIRNFAELYSADFTVYLGTVGCRNTWGVVKILAREMEKSGYPSLILNSDVFDERVESWGITETRIEEFLELRGLLA